jgi:hypothetical protein
MLDLQEKPDRQQALVWAGVGFLYVAAWTALVLGSKEIDGIFKSVDEDIHLLLCVVEVKTGTGTCGDTEGSMQNLCAMMPWPNCHAMLKQNSQAYISSALLVLPGIFLMAVCKMHHKRQQFGHNVLLFTILLCSSTR